MKVLHINAGLESGGGLTHIVNLLSQAKKEGQDFDLLTFAEGPVAQAAREKGIKTLVLGTSSRYDLTLLKRLKQTIKAGHYDLVHSHGARANLFVSLIKSSLPCPWFITVHSDPAIDFEGRGVAGKIFTKLNLRAIKQADGLFAITPRFEKILLAYGVDKEKIHVIYNGINFQDNKTLPAKEDHAGFNIINVGRLEKVKGQDLLLKAFKAADLPKAHLYIAGSGSQEEN
ncbi:glycosyltransferase, partial [Lactobacillus nasalidis]